MYQLWDRIINIPVSFAHFLIGKLATIGVVLLVLLLVRSCCIR